MSTQEIVELAKQIATKAHLGQFRRGGLVPYIEHPAAVASRVGEDLDAQIVAWLHDTIEDCPVTAKQLLDAGIPEHCVAAVELMSKKKGDDYESYLEAIAASPLARKVKIADMISNLADNPSVKQLKKYSKGLLRLTRDL